ncbi:hypothetical protein CPB83DRAFT_841987 [Crepidotus variabilis]|uniref:Copper acquisition factor BIM1-like domain-containing protein n=1 Tax=Crepidotus variabilis TaxID=179855 RepID=A0A9P6EVC1_9AGAR|nr:hypothetical protein CPB83DRAFT_841987 [Crepidotus variabilis]
MLKMLTLIFCLIASASAHFHLLYPGPRGAFVAQNELQFCGNLPEVTTNRTTFPLSGGYINIQTGHPNWLLGVIISTDADPNTWEDFNIAGTNNQQFVKYYGKQANPGTYCIPLDLKASGIAGVQEGSNVTIQAIFQGGDGNLYQCADLTLSANASPPSDQPCKNVTDTAAVSSLAAASSSSAAAAKPSQTGGASHLAPAVIVVTLLGTLIVTLSL